MSHEMNGNGRTGEAAGRLVVVRVEETIEPKLTARVGARYESPPQTRERAMTLVRLLLGRDEAASGEQEWTAPIAGGRRVVTLTEERDR